MEVLILGRPKQRPPPGQAHTHTHSRLGFREPKRLKSFEKLLKNPIPKDDVDYLSQRLWTGGLAMFTTPRQKTLYRIFDFPHTLWC